MRMIRRGWRCICAGALLLSLVACSGLPQASGPGDGKTDLMTSSDEPAARARARTRLELAVGYFDQGQTTIALDELKQALVADPGYPDAYNLRGLIYMRLNDLALAQDSFRRALELNPRDANTQHNYGWLLCQQGRYEDAYRLFNQALSSPVYGDRAKTLMTLGLCQARDGQVHEAERSLAKSYELDAANPISGYNLALLLYKRGELVRAQFYIRRINNSDLANAETLWLGVRVERRLGNREAAEQLASQLRKRFPASRELAALDQGKYDE